MGRVVGEVAGAGADGGGAHDETAGPGDVADQGFEAGALFLVGDLA